MLIILIGTIAVMYNSAGNSGPKYAEVLDFFYNEQVDSFILDGDTLQLQLKDGRIVNYLLPDWNLFFNDLNELIKQQKDAGVLTTYDVIAAREIPWWVSMIPYLVMIVILACSGII